MSTLNDTSLNRRSGASSLEQCRSRSPETPPQIDLSFEPVALAANAGFSGLFPWVKHNEPRTEQMHILQHDVKPTTEKDVEAHRDLAAFQSRPSVQLTSEYLQTLAPAAYVDQQTLPPSSNHFIHIDSPVLSLPYQQNALPDEAESVAPCPVEQETATWDFVSSAMAYTTIEPGSEPGDQRNLDNTHVMTSASSDQRHPSLSLHHAIASPEAAPHTSTFPPQECSPLSRESHSAHTRLSWTGSSQLQQDDAAQSDADLSAAQPDTTGITYDLFEDDKLPGFQVWMRSAGRPAFSVRIPRQMVGWKAVLTGLDDAAPSSQAVAWSKKAWRTSKALGRPGWEVRQEAIKNSYDFRRGSGIGATMHAGHRLFKHDWHLILKDGSRLLWKMDRHALALFRCWGESEVQVGEFRKAVPVSSTRPHNMHGEPDPTTRIGSFTFEESSAREAGEDEGGDVFDAGLALASLMAVFGARGGYANVSAAFEASSDPMRQWLEEKRQQAPDREEQMLAMPMPGFARDTESVLSDTTDEDANSYTGDTLPRRREAARPHRRATPQRDATPREMIYDDARPSRAEVREDNKTRKRLSTLLGFGNSSAPRGNDVAKEATKLTDSQRIARQYRSRSFLPRR